jgi:uracil-DNA glycosylase
VIISEELERALRDHAPSANVFNPYRHRDADDCTVEAPAMRLANLSQHFNCEPRFLLVGEAPGYHGCHFSGVPFTSEAQILAGRVPRVLCARLTLGDQPRKEASATVMWGVLRNLGIERDTVMWNAYPWHPYKEGDPTSNRAPTVPELRAAAHITKMVICAFPAATVIAVGQVARRTLDKMNIVVKHCVRHPSMGGANQFRAMMRAIVEPPQ